MIRKHTQNNRFFEIKIINSIHRDFRDRFIHQIINPNSHYQELKNILRTPLEAILADRLQDQTMKEMRKAP